ncbi:MAG: type I glutamate--ammonia ligase [Chloroflexota bacterium]
MRIDDKRNYVDMTKDDILALVEENNIQYISLWFTDITGTVKSVVVPANKLSNVIETGVHFDGSAVEGFARVAESDMILLPDLNTFAILPWHNTDEERTARLICGVYTPQGEPFIGDPRNALIRALESASEMNLTFKTGMELEFFLFYTDAYGKPVIDAPQDGAGYFDHADEKSQVVRRKMVNALLSMGIQVHTAYSETGKGQHEIDFQYSNALVSADQILTTRVALKTIAQQHGLHCTFMPRPVANQPGSGMHTHQTIHDCDTDANVFVDTSHEYHLSDTARHFLAGQLNHARAMSAILAPLVNSYKRLGTSFEAPVYVTWAHINRGALIRIPSTSPGRENHTRLELRCPDPSANPYLAQAVMLMAGLDGIRQKMELPDPLEETLLTRSRGRLRQVETLPSSLEEAIDVMTNDDVIMGALGPYISDRYIAAKRQEIESYNQQVTQWELDRYLGRY